MKNQSHWVKSLDFTELSHGTKLEKFIAKSDAECDGEIMVELHGFVDEQGKFHITNEILCGRAGEDGT